MFSGLIGIEVLKVRQMIKGTNKDPFSYAVLHDPDQAGVLTKLPFMKWIRNPIKLFLVSLIFFAFIGLYSTQSNNFFAFAPELVAQQISPFAEVVFAFEPSATAETVFFIAFEVSILYGFLRWMQRKLNLNNAIFYVLLFSIVPLLVGISWSAYHNLAYPESEIAGFNTFIFGSLGALLTLLFGSIFVWYAWHVDNNLFFQLNRLFDNDAVFTITLLLLIFIVVITVIFFFITRNKKEFIEPKIA